MVDLIKRVELLHPDGTSDDAELFLWEEDSVDTDKVRISINSSGLETTRSDRDFFAAMCLIRRELESNNLLLKCYGASKNVYPSPMSRSMGYGSKAYKLYPGLPATQEDIVFIFDIGPDCLPATVDDQQNYYKEWLDSLGEEA